MLQCIPMPENKEFEDSMYNLHIEGVQRRRVLVVNFFVNFETKFFCFVVAICDLVHDVEAVFYLQ